MHFRTKVLQSVLLKKIFFGKKSGIKYMYDQFFKSILDNASSNFIILKLFCLKKISCHKINVYLGTKQQQIYSFKNIFKKEFLAKYFVSLKLI